MKMTTKIVISAILAIIATYFISKKLRSSDSLFKLLKKTPLTNLNGVAFDNNELKGKVVILSYFQTWCSDCVKEHPDLEKLRERFGNKLTVLLVSDEPSELVYKYRDKFPSALNYYLTTTPLKKEGIVKHFPTTYLINPDGEVKEVKVEDIHWYTPETIAMIEQMLAL